ncbi:hypothetical protein N7533_009463 [Penicillium manginii]|uniref:uncharacterized protein n=1 Tax=Penicillium manginii TaxID=203109 RepID=UPI002549771F|nr:uncharacterized protein N7533_009463 [Penicillium manginii]KAJ5744593.1 hypothetical protein N7533_009463 [Penicillium manginii]
MSLPVLINGAGLGGVCLAQALKKNNIPFKLFERNGQSNVRAQGYRLRITSSGVEALDKALTPEVFTLFEKTCADAPKLGVRVKPDGSTAPFAAPPGGPGGRAYTVDRSVFRDTLLTGLEGNVFFDKNLEQYTVHEDKVTVSFSDGTTEDGALLVGADGVRSSVRRQHIPNFRGLDTGMRIIFGKTPLTPEFLAKLPEEYRDGMSLVTNEDDNSQPVLMFESIQFPHAEEVSTVNIPAPYMYWVLVVHRSKISSSDQDSWHLSASEAANLVDQLTSSWNPHIRTIFGMSDINQTSIHSILSAGPEIDGWRPSARVTLLGDAAHVMPPTGAMGANTALRDAADLAQRIVAVGGVQSVDEAMIGSYEADLRDFAKTAIELSWRGGLKSFGLKPVEECEPISM